MEKIAAFLHDSPDDAEREWLRAWLIRSLDVVFPGEGEPALRLRDALDAGPGDPEQLAEAEMFLAAAGTSDLDSDAVRLLVAFHRSQAGNLVTVLQGAFGDELRDFTINRFETADVRGDFRCYHFDGEFHLGVEATFRGRDARKLAALGLAFFEQNSQKTMRFWLGRASADLPHLNEGRISSWLDPNGELLQCVKRERWDELSRRLRTANDSQFQDFAQTVGGKYTARPAFYRTADNAFWVGIRLSLLDPKTKARDNELMEAVLTSALPVLALESWQNLARPAAADTIDRHRIAWLMKFLLDPLTLGKFAINR